MRTTFNHARQTVEFHQDFDKTSLHNFSPQPLSAMDLAKVLAGLPEEFLADVIHCLTLVTFEYKDLIDLSKIELLAFAKMQNSSNITYLRYLIDIIRRTTEGKEKFAQFDPNAPDEWNLDRCDPHELIKMGNELISHFDPDVYTLEGLKVEIRRRLWNKKYGK